MKDDMKCKVCFGKNKLDRDCDIAIPPCQHCKGTGIEPDNQDEIRKAFEKFYVVDDYLFKYSDKDNYYHSDRKNLIDDTTTLNRILHGYRNGYKSRDKEVIQLGKDKIVLRDRIDELEPECDLLNKEVSELKAKLKVAEDALEEIKDCYTGMDAMTEISIEALQTIRGE
jgi:hypothetical protein